MATATTLTSRWNAALPNQSLRTSDIGIKNATILVNGKMLHVTMEMPIRFDTVSPLDGSNITVSFEEGCYFMVAAGQLNPWYGPNKHDIKNVATNLVKIEDEGESEDDSFPDTTFCTECVCHGKFIQLSTFLIRGCP